MVEEGSRPPQGPERRAAPRRPSELKVYCCPVGGMLTERRQVRLRNVSRQGLALITDRRWAPGTVLAVELPLAERPIAVRAKVVHATAQPGGTFLVGCMLDNALTDAQVELVTAGGPPPEPDDRR
jgi:hypothetical protein